MQEVQGLLACEVHSGTSLRQGRQSPAWTGVGASYGSDYCMLLYIKVSVTLNCWLRNALQEGAVPTVTTVCINFFNFWEL